MRTNSIGRIMQKVGSMLSGGSRRGGTGRTTTTRTRTRGRSSGGIGSILRRLFR